MNWKNRLTNYNFWISIFSTVLLVLQALKIKFDIAYANEIFTAVLGLLVVIGIINDPTKTSVKTTEQPKKENKTQTEVVNTPISNVEEIKTNFINNENDFKAVLEKISNDLNAKFEELQNKTINKIEVSQIREEEKETKNQEITLPAAAEIENPYIDLNN